MVYCHHRFLGRSPLPQLTLKRDQVERCVLSQELNAKVVQDEPRVTSLLSWPLSLTAPMQAFLMGIVLLGSSYVQARTQDSANPDYSSARPTLVAPELQPLPLLMERPGAAKLSEMNSAESPSANRTVIAAQTLENLGVSQVPIDFVFSPATEEANQLIKPWWFDQAKQNDSTVSIPAELDDLIWLAISNSPHVQSVLLQPQILDAQASQKLGVFDPNRFVDSIIKDTSDPVGNSLVTGGPPRLNDNLWENRAGVRAKNQYGGQVEFFQEAMFKNSNSRFFTPNNQADTKMVLQYTQPLKRGRGRDYNRSSFVIATFAANQGRYQASQALQEHAFQISEAYWNLYVARITELQVQRGLENLTLLRDRLKGRNHIDSLRSQILRAEAAIAKQTAAQANARAQVRSNEAFLRSLIASPELRESAKSIIPISETINTSTQVDPVNERLAALESQPTILEIQEEIKAARTKLNVANNELQPTLNLVLQGYLHGLKGDYNFGQSLINQVTNTPSYHAGIAYQRPKGNLAAQAIARESRMELRQALLKLDDTLLTVSANVESAAARIEAAYQQLDSSIRSTLATQAEIQFLEAQWNDAFMAGDSRSSLQLDQLLNAHIQLITSENSWVQAERDYMMSIAQLALSSGRLLPTFPCN